jgi:hypothetical protein
MSMVSLISSLQIKTHFRYRFSRGWTLQELIAPGSGSTFFFDEEWNYVGSKQSLCSQLSLITGISAGVLSHTEALSSIRVAHKMSWAAKRETTRIEDMAYCLLGLFDINMPLLYGEESKAFRRLQEEIIRTRPDLSIFAWWDESSDTKQPPAPADLRYHCGVLARTPFPFGSARSLFAQPSRSFSKEFSVCNHGVKTQSIVFRSKGPFGRSGNYILPLSLSRAGHCIGIRLRKIGRNTYVRHSPFNLHEYIDAPECITHIPEDNYILVDKPPSDPHLVRTPFFLARGLWTDLFLESQHRDFLSIEFAAVVEVQNYWGCFDREDQVFFVPEGDQTDCAGMRFAVHLPENDLGFDPFVTFECVVYAIGWSTPGETIQYTIIGPEQRKKDISIIGREFTQGSNSPSRLRPILNRLGIRKQSSTAFPIAGSRYSVLVSLELLHLSRKIRVSCRIEKTKRIPLRELSFELGW